MWGKKEGKWREREGRGGLEEGGKEGVSLYMAFNDNACHDPHSS